MPDASRVGTLCCRVLDVFVYFVRHNGLFVSLRVLSFKAVLLVLNQIKTAAPFHLNGHVCLGSFFCYYYFKVNL